MTQSKLCILRLRVIATIYMFQNLTEKKLYNCLGLYQGKEISFLYLGPEQWQAIAPHYLLLLRDGTALQLLTLDIRVSLHHWLLLGLGLVGLRVLQFLTCEISYLVALYRLIKTLSTNGLHLWPAFLLRILVISVRACLELILPQVRRRHRWRGVVPSYDMVQQ